MSHRRDSSRRVEVPDVVDETLADADVIPVPPGLAENPKAFSANSVRWNARTRGWNVTWTEEGRRREKGFYVSRYMTLEEAYVEAQLFRRMVKPVKDRGPRLKFSNFNQ